MYFKKLAELNIGLKRLSDAIRIDNKLYLRDDEQVTCIMAEPDFTHVWTKKLDLGRPSGNHNFFQCLRGSSQAIVTTKEKEDVSLLALDPTDGRLLWEVSISPKKLADKGAPVVWENRVCIAIQQSKYVRFVVYHILTGERVAELNLPESSVSAFGIWALQCGSWVYGKEWGYEKSTCLLRFNLADESPVLEQVFTLPLSDLQTNGTDLYAFAADPFRIVWYDGQTALFKGECIPDNFTYDTIVPYSPHSQFVLVYSEEKRAICCLNLQEGTLHWRKDFEEDWDAIYSGKGTLNGWYLTIQYKGTEFKRACFFCHLNSGELEEVPEVIHSRSRLEPLVLTNDYYRDYDFYVPVAEKPTTDDPIRLLKWEDFGKEAEEIVLQKTPLQIQIENIQQMLATVHSEADYEAIFVAVETLFGVPLNPEVKEFIRVNESVDGYYRIDSFSRSLGSARTCGELFGEDIPFADSMFPAILIGGTPYGDYFWLDLEWGSVISLNHDDTFTEVALDIIEDNKPTTASGFTLDFSMKGNGFWLSELLAFTTAARHMKPYPSAGSDKEKEPFELVKWVWKAKRWPINTLPNHRFAQAEMFLWAVTQDALDSNDCKERVLELYNADCEALLTWLNQENESLDPTQAITTAPLNLTDKFVVCDPQRTEDLYYPWNNTSMPITPGQYAATIYKQNGLAHSIAIWFEKGKIASLKEYRNFSSIGFNGFNFFTKYVGIFDKTLVTNRLLTTLPAEKWSLLEEDTTDWIRYDVPQENTDEVPKNMLVFKVSPETGFCDSYWGYGEDRNLLCYVLNFRKVQPEPQK
ncbi:PQQ-binding-like beta-propeller repeat protein [Xanthocytophaga agilis]|uniref:PQQ-binding-like beta-propeller repeat protein n=1 Tax=Xanthocytophaga agilis TaxID=3048010 RepID=A0AAE3UHC3_9BACT|nr:PQQ-binding-like beta-propeller repeat protein [Xanthocytophaga agilis]MDJ1505305.1 PQQ-binding-like beta-propeller repeat protein [Xanthocytophaga agilis]